MISVYGRIKELHEADDQCPHDGVHRAKPDGTIRHPRIGMLDRRPLFYGNEGMFIDRGTEFGLKVYYALRLGAAWSLEQVEYVAEMMRKFESVAVTPGRIEKVDLDVRYRGAWINRQVWGLEVQQVHYPMNAWKRYCRGHAYDWKAVKHPDHSPEGFLRFVASAKAVIPELHVKSLTLGNTAWDTKTSRWLVMDVDWRGPEHMK
jgi:hypothetical protein